MRATSALHVDEPYVLVVPTYGGGDGQGAVPKQVIRFLNDPQNRSLIRGVIGAGNTNFGEAYGLAGDIIAAKCQGAAPLSLRSIRNPRRRSRRQRRIGRILVKLSSN